MIEDRDSLPQPHGRDPDDTRPRTLISPEPRCDSHERGRCSCEDDGSGAFEFHPEDEAMQRGAVVRKVVPFGGVSVDLFALRGL